MDKNNFWRTSDTLSFTIYPHFAKEQTNKGEGHLGLIVMHLFKAYAQSITTDIDRFTRHS